MTIFLLLATSALSIATAPIAAGEARPAAAATSQLIEAGARAPTAQRVTRYCVVNQVTGSRIPRRTCKTRADWLADEGVDPLAKDD
ncbi:hypothetical protein [Sphingomonas sp. UYP23]